MLDDRNMANPSGPPGGPTDRRVDEILGRFAEMGYYVEVVTLRAALRGAPPPSELVEAARRVLRLMEQQFISDEFEQAEDALRAALARLDGGTPQQEEGETR